METEYFFSGYCRTLDQSRMVSAEFSGNTLLEVDCSYESCPYTDRCTIADQIKKQEKENV